MIGRKLISSVASLLHNMNTEIKKIEHDFYRNGQTSEVVSKINEIIEAINRINKVLSSSKVKE